MKKVLLSTLILTSPLTAAPYEEIEDRSELTVLTPSLAERETAKIRLANGLEALLISDPGVDQSGAALAVEVGSWQDPDERPGLAHFCEHMLFLGNEKYPEEAGFTSFVEEHGGTRNAYTTDRTTNYMFAVNNESFDEALDRFAHFFIEPLFTVSAMRREVKAVNSEFARTLSHDGWREAMVRKALVLKEHPDSRFTCGNLSTLGDVATDELKEWFDTHYSSHLMHLVILSDKPMQELKESVAATFGEIPRREVGPFPVQGRQTDPEVEGNLVVIAPHMDRRQLSLSWELPYSFEVSQECQAGQLLCAYLGYEGPGSLLQQLKAEGLAEALSAGMSEYRVPHSDRSFLYLSIDLTERGLAERDTVIERTFQAIERVRHSGIPRHFYDEQQKIAFLSHAYQSRQEVFSTVQNHSARLVEEELATYPRHSLLASRYAPEAIDEIVNQLTPNSCLFALMVPPQEIGVRLSKTEPWTETAYEVMELAQEILDGWAAAGTHPEIVLPGVNPFIPDNLELVYDGPVDRSMPHPTLLVDDNFGKIYWAMDRQYHVPELHAQFNIVSNAVDPADPRTAVMIDLMARSVSEELGPTRYMATLAGLRYGIAPSWHGLSVTASGYSDKGHELIAEIAEAIRRSRPSPEQFVLYRDSLARDYQNFEKQPPIAQAQELTQEVIYRDFSSHAEKERAIATVSYDDLLQFMDHFSKETYIKGVVYGNLGREDGVALWEAIHEHVQTNPYPAGKTVRPEVVQLPEGRGPFFLEKRIHNQGIAVMLAVQQGEFSFAKRAAQQILAMGIETPFFDELRTKQQTGYVCASADTEIEGELFQYFAVESTSHDPRDLLARFELMIEQFLRLMPEATFPPAKFEAIRGALVSRLSQPPKNLSQMGGLLYLLAFDKEGDFDYREKRIAAAESLTYDDFLQSSLSFLGKNNKRRFAAIVLGQLDRDHTLQYEKATSLRRLTRLSHYGNQEVVNIDDKCSKNRGDGL